MVVVNIYNNPYIITKEKMKKQKVKEEVKKESDFDDFKEIVPFVALAVGLDILGDK